MANTILVRVPERVLIQLQKEAKALGIKDHSSIVRAAIDLYMATGAKERRKHVLIPPPPKRKPAGKPEAAGGTS